MPNIKVTTSLGIRTSVKLRKFDTQYRNPKLRKSCGIGIRGKRVVRDNKILLSQF